MNILYVIFRNSILLVLLGRKFDQVKVDTVAASWFTVPTFALEIVTQVEFENFY